MAAWNQARWLSGNCPQERRAGEALQPPWQWSHPPLYPDRRDVGPAALAVLHHPGRRLLVTTTASLHSIAFATAAMTKAFSYTLSTSSNWTATISDLIRLRAARPRLRWSWPRPRLVSGSMSTWKATARPCSGTHASSASKVSCRSVRTLPIVPAAHPIGSRWRTPTHPRFKREAEEDWGKDRWRSRPGRLLCFSLNARRWSNDDFDVVTNGSWSAEFSRPMRHLSGHRGCGHWRSGTMKIARRRTAMLQRARPRWRRLPRAGGGYDTAGLFVFFAHDFAASRIH